jgi:hypothetical protein
MITSSNDTNLKSAAAWLLRDAPNNAGSVDACRPSRDWLLDKDDFELWTPVNVRLTDRAVVFAYLTLSKTYRTQNLRYDFDSRGEIRKDRVPVGPTIRLTDTEKPL